MLRPKGENVMGLRYPPVFEDMAVGIASLKRLAGLQFDTALFMHGKPLNGVASKRFLDKWGL